MWSGFGAGAWSRLEVDVEVGIAEVQILKLKIKRLCAAANRAGEKALVVERHLTVRIEPVDEPPEDIFDS